MSTQKLEFSSQTKKASVTYSSTEFSQQTRTISSTSSTWSTSFLRSLSTMSEEDNRPFLRSTERATIATSKPRLAPREPARKRSLLNDAMLYQEASTKPEQTKKSLLKNGPVYIFSNSQLDKNKNVVNTYETDIRLLTQAFAKFNMKVVLKKEKTKSRIQRRIKESKYSP